MKKMYTPEMVLAATKTLDVRAQKLSDEKLATVINDAYTELSSISAVFSDEEVIALAPFYELGEELVTIDIQEDVTDIYDLYLTEENKDKDIYLYGIEKIRDKKVIYKDNRYNGRVHIDFSTLKTPTDNAVIKYYYVPTYTTENVYMDAQTWLTFKSALGVSLYDMLHDVERNGQKRAELTRRAKNIMPDRPEDANDPSYGHIFTGLTH